MKKILLSISLMICLMGLNGAWAQTTIYTENFSTASLPAGWANDSLGLPATHTWIFNNQYLRTITGAGFDANFAIFDSDQGSTNDNFDENASLTTAPISIAGITGILFLEFDEQYRALSGPNTSGSSRRVEISTDAGVTWSTLVYDSVNVGYPNPAAHTSLNINSAIGSSAIQVRYTYTGSYDWWWAIDNVKIVNYSNCSAAPTAGTAQASASQVCSGVNFTLSVTGADTGAVISYQWQSSTDNITWTNIPGAIGINASASCTAPTFYRCEVSCGSFSSQTNSVSVSLNPPNFCYCNSGLGGATCPSIDFIRNVNLVGTNLNNSDTICNYSNGSNISIFAPTGSSTALLTIGSSYTLSVTTSSNNIISVWIDLNQNGIYETTEWKQICTTSVAGVANTVNIDIPWGTTQGLTGMRIRSRATGNPNDSASACTSFGSGEAEDYLVTIDLGTRVSAIQNELNFTAIPNPATSNLTISFATGTNENAVLKLMNISGQVVYSETIQTLGKFTKTIDVSALSRGIYNLQYSSSKGVVNKKISLE